MWGLLGDSYAALSPASKAATATAKCRTGIKKPKSHPNEPAPSLGHMGRGRVSPLPEEQEGGGLSRGSHRRPGRRRGWGAWRPGTGWGQRVVGDGGERGE